jgi:carbon storage regulator
MRRSRYSVRAAQYTEYSRTTTGQREGRVVGVITTETVVAARLSWFESSAILPTVAASTGALAANKGASAMLVLSRRKGERIFIGRNIVVEVVECSRGSHVRLGISAPQEVPIHREEVAARLIEQGHGLPGPLISSDPTIPLEGCST